jgi:hypothetical protein
MHIPPPGLTRKSGARFDKVLDQPADGSALPPGALIAKYCNDPKLNYLADKFTISKPYRLFSPWKPSTYPAANLASFKYRHPKSSSPQMPLEDREIISAVFVGLGIREGFGKVTSIVWSRSTKKAGPQEPA